jgi:hypothetical protein
MNNTLQRIKEGLTFGNESHNNSFLAFFVKSLSYTLPAMIMGVLVDKFVSNLQKKEKLGTNKWCYVMFQLVLNVLVLFACLRIISYKYASEFQNTLPGMFFSTLFFGVQFKWIQNLESSL